MIYERGALAVQERIVEELRLVGFSVTRKEGRESDVREQERRGAFDAIVYVRKQKGAILSFPSASEEDPRQVRLDRHQNESDHLLALRTAEQLHGELLEAEPSQEQVVHHRRHDRPRPYFVAVTAGPALMIRSYASVGPGFVADAAYFPLRRLGLGAFVSPSLMRQLWTPAPDQFEISEFSAGAQVRGVLLQQNAPGFELQALGRLGGRVLSLHGLAGNPNDRFSGSASALILGGGLEMNYVPLRWLAVGTQVGGMLGLPLAWPQVTDDLKKPEQRALTEQQDAGPDGTFTATVNVSIRF